MLKIPINNDPSQQFELELEGHLWTFRVDYNSRGGYWSLGLDKDGEPVVEGIKLVLGISLMRAFYFMDGALIALDNNDTREDPTIGSWDTTAELYYLTPDEVAEIENS